MVAIAAPSWVCCRLLCMCPGNRCHIICSLLCFFFLSETLLTFAWLWITLIHVISCALSRCICHTAWGEMCKTDKQHSCVLQTLRRGAMWHLSPTRRPYFSTHLPSPNWKGSPLRVFLSLAAEPGLSHPKQLPFLIYTSGVGSLDSLHKSTWSSLITRLKSTPWHQWCFSTLIFCSCDSSQL